VDFERVRSKCVGKLTLYKKKKIDSILNILLVCEYLFWSRVFEDQVLRRVFGPKRNWHEAGEDCTVRSFITCTLHLTFLGCSYQGVWEEQSILRAWERWEMQVKFWFENLKGRDYSENLGLGWRIIRECIQKLPDWVTNEIYMLKIINTRWEASQRVMTAKLTDWFTK
jgi:hypothetical protein